MPNSTKRPTVDFKVSTRLITMRSQPNYFEVVVVINIVVVVIIVFVPVHVGFSYGQ